MQNRSSYSIFCIENDNIIIISLLRVVSIAFCIIFLSWVNQTENLGPPLLCATRASCMPASTRRLCNIYKNNLATCIHNRVSTAVRYPGGC